VEDGRWYGGTPIWVHAMRAGMTTASYYFVGSEAPIQGMTPTYYHKYDGSVPNAERVHQALEWLALPEADRPRLIAMYFSDMDDVGHRHSPLADEVLAPRLMALDSILGVLFDGIAATGLPVNIVLVSDHGMTPIPVQQLLPIELLEDDDRYRTVNTGALAHFYLHPDEDINQVLSAIRRAGKHYDVFLTRDVPYFDIPPTNDRWGDLIAIPHEGHYFVNARTMAMRQRGPAVIGEHGFDPGMRDMHTIFYAKGPALRSNLTIPPFQNIHVFPLLCRILQLDIPEDIDGRAEVLEGVLRR
jgi:predicted AlkP superfamily pyrophosphatase or phosphodiesterase